jgi:DNA repair protein RadC
MDARGAILSQHIGAMRLVSKSRLFDCKEGAKMPIPDWPEACRPRERLLSQGAGSLSDAELLAVFLRTGLPGKSAVDLGRDLLSSFGSLRALLSAGAARLDRIPGVGPAKFAQLQAALELGRRLQQEQLTHLNVLETPRRVRNFLRATLRQDSHESLGALLLDARNRLIGYQELFRGTLDRVHVHPREVVRLALERRASGLILAHNHPSGDPLPSKADRLITLQLQKALRLVDITLHDHFIVAGRRVYSFSEHGDMLMLEHLCSDC